MNTYQIFRFSDFLGKGINPAISSQPKAFHPLHDEGSLHNVGRNLPPSLASSAGLSVGNTAWLAPLSGLVLQTLGS